jgi:protein-tyrosine phosphatase
MHDGFVDIHCHLLPGIDDGSPDVQSSLAMARMAVADGTRTIVVTPHQLGNFAQNRGEQIRQRTAQFQQTLSAHDISLEILPGADVRIEDHMLGLLSSGEVLTLGDHGRHVLLELPHELYFPLEGVLAELSRRGITGILSHPERNHGLLRDPDILPSLVDSGCLMQVTAGSLLGTFGPNSQQLAEWMLSQGLVHFLATDAHGVRARRPLLGRAFERVQSLAELETAIALCSTNPSFVARGAPVPAGRRPVARRGWSRFLSARRTG